VFLFGLFLEAYMHDFNLVYITLFFLFSFAFSAGPFGVLNIGKLKAEFVSSGRFFANRDAFISIKVTNPREVASWAVEIHSTNSLVPLDRLNAKSSTILQMPYTPTKRGLFEFKDCYFNSKYPLSTARLTLNITDVYRGVAYPQPKGKTLESFLNEEENHYGQEKDFDGLREYDGTQKLSHIHWASVAKGSMSVKHFSKEILNPNLHFDFQKAGKNDEARLSQLCLWVLECEKKSLIFSIQLGTKIMSCQKESIDEILTALARY
jgi:uncharacterized protein (DUF58 family)